MKTAVIIGAAGQDGYWLSQSLRADGFSIVAIDRSGVGLDDEPARPFDVCAPDQMDRLIRDTMPDEIYHLAAEHGSSEDAVPNLQAFYEKAWRVHCAALVNLCEALRRHKPNARLFYAASSRVFGKPETSPQDENTARRPLCAYGLTKAQGMDLCRYYRDAHGLFCVAGILYNHESPQRPDRFVSRKIARAAALAELGRLDSLPLGAPEAVVDWGAAPDYVAAMRLMLGLEAPVDAVIASGIGSRVEDFAKLAFRQVGLDAKDFIVRDAAQLHRAPDSLPLVGNPGLLEMKGWRRQYDLESLVAWMVQAERREIEGRA